MKTIPININGANRNNRRQLSHKLDTITVVGTNISSRAILIHGDGTFPNKQSIS